jgi:hypothetical protein
MYIGCGGPAVRNLRVARRRIHDSRKAMSGRINEGIIIGYAIVKKGKSLGITGL